MWEGVAGTLRADAGDNRLAVAYADNCILDDQGGRQISFRTDGKSPTLRAETHGNLPCVVSVHLTQDPITSNNTTPCLSAGSPTGQGCIGIAIGTFQNTGQGWWNEGPIAGTVRTPCGGDSTKANVTVEQHEGRYIVRRLTPTECARLQGFADRWGDIKAKDGFTAKEYQFWLEVRDTHARINGRAEKDYTPGQMLTWYNKLQTDSAEYKMWGNGIALPPALYCMQGIVDALNAEEEDAWLM